MSLREVRERYKSGNMTKKDYLERIRKVLGALEDVHAFMADTDVKSLRLQGTGIIGNFNSVPIEMFFDVTDVSSPLTQAMSFWDVEGDYSRKLIEHLKGAQVFFDIGANVGYYSLICGKTNPEARICAFEPMPSTYMSLVRNIALNACTNVFPYNFGLAEEGKTLEMYFDETESGAASLRDIRGTVKMGCKVNFVRLDDFVLEHNLVPDVVKIDVEGSELFVLKGAETTLKTHRPLIFIEILRKWCKAFGHSAMDVFEQLHRLGYRGHVVRETHLEAIDRIVDSTEDTNFIFLKS